MSQLELGAILLSLKQEIEKLRVEAATSVQQLANAIVDIRKTYATKEELVELRANINEDVSKGFSNITQKFDFSLQTLQTTIEELNNKIMVTNKKEEKKETETIEPTPSVIDSSCSTKYDYEHDTIMKAHLSSLIKQVPDPGEYDGETSKTELFCSLCESLFKTCPYNKCSELEKVDFVKCRLRSLARNWYFSKYEKKDPSTMDELLKELKSTFSNVTDVKLAKIELTQLRQEWGKINEYIEELKLSNICIPEEQTKIFTFYNGLHPSYKDEINKMDTFPETFDAITTKVIIFEKSLKTKNKLNQKNNQKHSSSYNRKSNPKNPNNSKEKKNEKNN